MPASKNLHNSGHPRCQAGFASPRLIARIVRKASSQASLTTTREAVWFDQQRTRIVNTT